MNGLICPNSECENFQTSGINAFVKNGRDRQGNQRYRCNCCKHTFTPSKVNNSSRPSYQNKPSTKGHKSQRGIPEGREQIKDRRINAALTQTGKEKLDQFCEDLQFSRNELIERIGQRNFELQNLPGVRECLAAPGDREASTNRYLKTVYLFDQKMQEIAERLNLPPERFYVEALCLMEERYSLRGTLLGLR